MTEAADDPSVRDTARGVASAVVVAEACRIVAVPGAVLDRVSCAGRAEPTPRIDRRALIGAHRPPPGESRMPAADNPTTAS